MSITEKAGARAAQPASHVVSLGGADNLENSRKSLAQQDAATVAAAELIECASNGAFYFEQLLRYVEHGDHTGARRALLMAEAGLIRAKVAWRIFDDMANERRAA